MKSKRRPQVHRARRPGARTESISAERVTQTRQTGKPRAILLKRLPDRSFAARDRSLHLIAALRNNPKLSPSRGARREGVKLETARKYFPSAFEKFNGKLRVTKGDRYTETLYVPDRDGNRVPVKTRSSKDRSTLGQYLRDLGRYQRGDRNALKKWEGKKVAGVELLTDERAIHDIEPALSDFSLYRAFNGGNV
jgi:hypothetical protein